MTQLSLQRVDTLPMLAWCAVVDQGRETVRVFHGSAVETGPDFFVTGAWDGPFGEAGFMEASIMSGTGGRMRNGGLSFTASTDTLSPLFSVRAAGKLVVSNSPVFALQTAGDAPDPLYPYYAYDIPKGLRQGLLCPDLVLPSCSGAGLHMHSFCTLSVGNDLSVSFGLHPPGEVPSDFATYRALLQRGVDAVLANARDPARRHPFAPLALVSAGYDCNATAALAAAAGCREGATLVSRHRAPDMQDSGVEVARALGMSCTEVDRLAYLRMEGDVESEFAWNGLASNPSFAAMESILPGRILIEGVFGDAIWDGAKAPHIDMHTRSWVVHSSGLSKLEHRLRVGYLSFAPAFIGARHNRRISDINSADEMSRWRVGGDYDRPIPRRILEEAGVPRGAFGVRKLAGSHAHHYKKGSLRPKALAAYDAFTRASRKAQPWYRSASWRLWAAVEHVLWKIVFRNAEKVPAEFPRSRLPLALPGRRHPLDHRFSFMFQWAFAALRDRYRLP